MLKKLNQEKADRVDMLEEKLKIAELAYALKSPVMEAAYALHERTPLRLFNGLVPKIASH